MFRRKGGNAARIESFVRLVRAYIHEYPHNDITHCAKTPGRVMSNKRWSASSRNWTWMFGRIEASILQAGQSRLAADLEKEREACRF
jgi:hypothetical protein